MKAFSKLDTGVAPHDQRHVDRRLAELLTEVETPMRERAVDYAPPAVRENWTAPVPALSRVEQLCLLCRELTFGEMVEFAEGIKADPAVIHAWATSYPHARGI